MLTGAWISQNSHCYNQPHVTTNPMLQPTPVSPNLHFDQPNISPDDPTLSSSHILEVIYGELVYWKYTVKIL